MSLILYALGLHLITVFSRPY